VVIAYDVAVTGCILMYVIEMVKKNYVWPIESFLLTIILLIDPNHALILTLGGNSL
jgi:hypothetical protein